ncbi:MAG: 50S ribosomal protein L29 [Planctomycetota bacterium]|nr:MAG: 50S ribosomal protein L29 [Planctomycetota bacterium]
MKIWQLRQLSEEELRERLAQLREELHKQVFQSYDESAKNPGKKRTLRREIARILTILQERERGIKGPIEPKSVRKEQRRNRKTETSNKA